MQTLPPAAAIVKPAAFAVLFDGRPRPAARPFGVGVARPNREKVAPYTACDAAWAGLVRPREGRRSAPAPRPTKERREMVGPFVCFMAFPLCCLVVSANGPLPAWRVPAIRSRSGRPASLATAPAWRERTRR